MNNILGCPLTDADYGKLETESWITREIADAASLFRVNSLDGANIVGRKNDRDYSGIVFPYFLPGVDQPREYRLRRDHPEYEYLPDGTRKEIDKYISPPGRGNMLYFAPGTTIGMLSDTSLPLVVAEGEKKILALKRLADHESDKPRFVPIGIAGVWNWRGAIAKELGPDGKLHVVKGPIKDLDLIKWSGRKVILLFDSDAQQKQEIKNALRRLANELEARL